MKHRIVSTDEIQIPVRKSPASAIMESIGDDYLTMRDMAERYGINLETMRRICKANNRDGTPKVAAPSSAVQQGGMIIYLFTREDVAEVDAYMAGRGYSVDGK